MLDDLLVFIARPQSTVRGQISEAHIVAWLSKTYLYSNSYKYMYNSWLYIIIILFHISIYFILSCCPGCSGVGNTLDTTLIGI